MKYLLKVTWCMLVCRCITKYNNLHLSCSKYSCLYLYLHLPRKWVQKRIMAESRAITTSSTLQNIIWIIFSTRFPVELFSYHMWISLPSPQSESWCLWYGDVRTKNIVSYLRFGFITVKKITSWDTVLLLLVKTGSWNNIFPSRDVLPMMTVCGPYGIYDSSVSAKMKAETVHTVANFFSTQTI